MAILIHLLQLHGGALGLGELSLLFGAQRHGSTMVVLAREMGGGQRLWALAQGIGV